MNDAKYVTVNGLNDRVEHAAKSNAELPETLGGMCWQQGTPPHRHYIQKVNVVIKMLWVIKDNFSNKFA